MEGEPRYDLGLQTSKDCVLPATLFPIKLSPGYLSGAARSLNRLRQVRPEASAYGRGLGHTFPVAGISLG